MSYLKAFFCCDTALQLSNIDTTCEVVKICHHKEENVEGEVFSAAELQQMRAASIRSQRTKKGSNIRPSRFDPYVPFHNTNKEIRISRVICNQGDDDEPNCFNDSGLLDDKEAATAFKAENNLKVISPEGLSFRSKEPPQIKKMPKKTSFVPHIRACLAGRNNKPDKANQTIPRKSRGNSRTGKSPIETKLEENLSEAQRYLQSIRQAIISRNAMEKSGVGGVRAGSRGRSAKKVTRKKGALSNERSEIKTKPPVLEPAADDFGLAVLTPSDNSSFSFTPTVVKPVLA